MLDNTITKQTRKRKTKRFSFQYRIGQVERVFHLSREMTAYDISKKIHLSQQNTNELLKRMEKEGFVVFREIPHRPNLNKRLWAWAKP